jgi:hypothetical protein
MAGVYSGAISSSPTLSDLGSNAIVILAPPVTAGDPRAVADVTTSVLEESGRNHLIEWSNSAVTEDEVASSVARTVAAVSEYAQGIYGGTGAPAGAAIFSLVSKLCLLAWVP